LLPKVVFSSGIRESKQPGRTGYAALSHVWGSRDNPPPKLTKDNEMLYQDRIPLEDLSKTFRDAIKVVQNLGLRYIWIDSL
jgi:hypothetical protein